VFLVLGKYPAELGTKISVKANAGLLLRVPFIGGRILPGALPAGTAAERGDSRFCFVIQLALPRKIV